MHTSATRSAAPVSIVLLPQPERRRGSLMSFFFNGVRYVFTFSWFQIIHHHINFLHK